MGQPLGNVVITIKDVEPVDGGHIITVTVQPGAGFDMSKQTWKPGTEERGIWYLPPDAPNVREAVAGVIAFLVDHPKAALSAWFDGEPAPAPGTPWRVQRGPDMSKPPAKA